MKKHNVHIAPLSGGLDSTYMIQKLLEAGEIVYSFHVSIKHKKYNRQEPELKAATYISNQFKLKYPNFKMKYFSMEYSDTNPGFDSDNVLLFAQKMCYALCTNININKIILSHGIVMDDLDKKIVSRMKYKGIGLNNLLQNALIDSMMYREKLYNISKIDRKINMPLIINKIYKKNIFNNIPFDLLDNVYQCRHNVECGKCYSCKKHYRAKNKCINY